MTPEVESVLRDSKTEGNILTLPDRQLPNYAEVKKFLELQGGKWTRKVQGFVFPRDAAAIIGTMLEIGLAVDHRKTYQQYFTPPELARMVALHASVEGKAVLEPSAGHGALAFACLEAGAEAVSCCEIDGLCVEHLRGKGLSVQQKDFLETKPMRELPTFSRIVMNPPFQFQKDCVHVSHAINFLEKGGILTAIIWADENRPKYKALENDPRINVLMDEAQPPGMYEFSGTTPPVMIFQAERI